MTRVRFLPLSFSVSPSSQRSVRRGPSHMTRSAARSPSCFRSWKLRWSSSPLRARKTLSSRGREEKTGYLERVSSFSERSIGLIVGDGRRKFYRPRESELWGSEGVLYSFPGNVDFHAAFAGDPFAV